MKKFLIFSILIFSLNISFAQKDTLRYKNSLSFSLHRPFNWFFPGIEISYERFYKKYSTQVSGTYLVQIFYPLTGINISNYKGYRFGLEQKYFFFNNKHVRPYGAINFEYANARYTTDEEFWYDYNADSLDYTYSYWDTYDATDERIIFNIKGGVQFKFSQFLIDFSAGGGLAIITTKHYNRKNPDDEMVMPIDIVVSSLNRVERDRERMPNFTLNIKIGYLF